MLRSGIILSALTGLCCLLSCGKKEEPFVPVEYNYFIAETAPFREIGFDELFNAIVSKYEEQGFDTQKLLSPYGDDLQKLRLASRQFTAYSITYRTVNPKGEAVTASGMLYYPFTSSVNGVIEICPGNELKKDCATKAIYLDELLCGAVGFICLVPDLIGCGATDSSPMAYLQSANKARVSADLRLAAGEFIHNTYRKDIVDNSYIVGFGLGAAHALELARYYSEHPEMGVNVAEVDAGGGFYNLPSVLDGLFDGGEHDFHLIPGMLYSAVQYSGVELDLGSVFKGEIKTDMASRCGGASPTAGLCDKLEDFMDLELFSPGKPAYDGAKEALAALNTDSSWIPSFPVNLMHATQDNLSPIENADLFVEKWKKAGANINYSKHEGLREEVFFLGGRELINRILNVK